MEREEIEAAAREKGLERILELFPEEVAAAMELAHAQAAAMRALPLEHWDAP